MTARELRESDIRDSFRGYHRDDVDDLLERAAVTIEHLEHQVRTLRDLRPTAATSPPDAPAEPAHTRSAPHPDDDLIAKTLILAQKTADETVAEARTRAEQLLHDSEARADAMVQEADATARRIAENEQRRAEAEISRLDATRTALSADVDALETFANEYRDRIRHVLEDDFERLLAAPSVEAPSPRPELSNGSEHGAAAYREEAHDRALEPAGRSLS
jgi:cell division septum initiation protein DivIVA